MKRPIWNNEIEQDFLQGMWRVAWVKEQHMFPLLPKQVSIISALSMTANSAKKKTLSQMEEIFCTDIDGLNEYLYAYKFYPPHCR